MHVVSMTPEQLSKLPPEQRNTYMQIVSCVQVVYESILNIFSACYARDLIDRVVYISVIDWTRRVNRLSHDYISSRPRPQCPAQILLAIQSYSRAALTILAHKNSDQVSKRAQMKSKSKLYEKSSYPPSMATLRRVHMLSRERRHAEGIYAF